ncbi:thioredoxin [Diplonema papillatum]|nr:thioredoxin [Diplonema papillatum]
MAMQDFLQRIFPASAMTPGMSKDDFRKVFDQRLRDFEEGGFLEQTHLPGIVGQDDFLRKLALHSNRNELMVIKFWKRSCIPCLSKAEMYKGVEQTLLKENAGIVLYSINIHDPANTQLADQQLVDGTPSLQKYWDYRQVGGEVRVGSRDGFLDNINATYKACQQGKCPTSMEPEF